ncbi:MAG: alpha/beta fold hydrolase [Nostocoides sp.]
MARGGGAATAARIGGAVAAAGLAAVAGAVVERRARDEPLDVGDPEIGYEHAPSMAMSVLADDGVRLYAEIDEPVLTGSAEGDRPTVIFSHGYCLSGRSWVLQRRAVIAAGYRVVVWDQRSHGMSDMAPAESCTIDQLGADLRAVVEATAADGSIVLVGHSMGGMTMLALADQEPELFADRVLAAALIGTTAGGRDVVNLGFGKFLGRFIGSAGPGLLGRLGAHQDRLNTFRRFGRDVEDTLVAKYSFDSPMSKDVVRFVGDIIFHTPFAVMGNFLPTLEAHDKRSALTAFAGVETLVLNGLGDLLTPPEHSDDIVRLVPGAEHVVVERAGHLVMLEHPDVVNAQLLELIERAERAFAEHVDVAAKPRVRRLVTDVTRLRRRTSKKAPGSSKAS